MEDIPVEVEERAPSPPPPPPKKRGEFYIDYSVSSLMDCSVSCS